MEDLGSAEDFLLAEELPETEDLLKVTTTRQSSNRSTPAGRGD